MVPSSSPSYCKACTAASKCLDCEPSAPAICLSCWSGYYLNTTDNTCVECTFPCTSCTGTTATACSSCAQGWVLISSNNTCMSASDVTLAVPNCANQVQSTSGTTTSVTCNLCLQGYTLTPAGCVPCIEGCLVCNANDLTTCTQC
jgi:hypothetical protein